jgi:hypothetical protein
LILERENCIVFAGGEEDISLMPKDEKHLRFGKN